MTACLSATPSSVLAQHSGSDDILSCILWLLSPILLSASTGYMFHSVSSSSWLCWLTNFCSVKHCITLVSCPCHQCAWPANTPVCQHQPYAGTVSETHLLAAEPFQSLERSAKHCYVCSVIILFPAASHDLSLSAILSGHYCDTRVDLAIVCLFRPL